jgi:hypothetical protein
MSWQDLVIGFGQALFAVFLIPALRSPMQKPPISTCALTGALLLAFGYAYLSLGLWWSMTAASFCGGCWLWLAKQQLEIPTRLAPPDAELLDRIAAALGRHPDAPVKVALIYELLGRRGMEIDAALRERSAYHFGDRK